MIYRKLIVTLPIYGIFLVLLTPYVYAGGPREDWPDIYGEMGDEGDRAAECWVSGFDDGQNNPFNQDRHKECLFDTENSYANKPYYEAFKVGCRDAGNTEEICERFTDA